MAVVGVDGGGGGDAGCNLAHLHKHAPDNPFISHPIRCCPSFNGICTFTTCSPGASFLFVKF